jgi:hypothetical protein
MLDFTNLAIAGPDGESHQIICTADHRRRSRLRWASNDCLAQASPWFSQGVSNPYAVPTGAGSTERR